MSKSTQYIVELPGKEVLHIAHFQSSLEFVSYTVGSSHMGLGGEICIRVAVLASNHFSPVCVHINLLTLELKSSSHSIEQLFSVTLQWFCDHLQQAQRYGSGKNVSLPYAVVGVARGKLQPWLRLVLET